MMSLLVPFFSLSSHFSLHSIIVFLILLLLSFSFSTCDPGFLSLTSNHILHLLLWSKEIIIQSHFYVIIRDDLKSRLWKQLYFPKLINLKYCVPNISNFTSISLSKTHKEIQRKLSCNLQTTFCNGYQQGW